MNSSSVTSAIGKSACIAGIAFYCYATLQMFVFVISKEEFSKHPEVVYFSGLVSIWGALPFVFLWFVRRRAYPLAAQIVLCIAAIAATTYEVWKLSLVLPQAANNARAVGEVLMSMPIHLWAVGIVAVLSAEIVYQLHRKIA